MAHQKPRRNRRSYHYIPVIMEAYKSGRPLADLQRYREVKKCLQRTENYDTVKELFKDRNLEDLCKYLTAQKANASSYADYAKACVYLGLDMSLERNLLPHEFRRWHDIRIDEYRTAMTIASENKRKEFYARFEAITEKYAALQHNKRSAFVAIIARSPADLITEGNALHHCVGRMNYDQRIVREESLIFFIRTRECPDTPFVTVEYSPSLKAVLQLKARRHRSALCERRLASLCQQNIEKTRGLTAKENLICPTISELRFITLCTTSRQSWTRTESSKNSGNFPPTLSAKVSKL